MKSLNPRARRSPQSLWSVSSARNPATHSKKMRKLSRSYTSRGSESPCAAISSSETQAKTWSGRPSSNPTLTSTWCDSSAKVVMCTISKQTLGPSSSRRGRRLPRWSETRSTVWRTKSAPRSGRAVPSPRRLQRVKLS